MATWQERMTAALRDRLGDDGVRPHGSVVAGDVDRWSDLDVRLALDRDVAATELFDGSPWAWQDVRDGADQVLRMVLADGRRVDAVVTGARVTLPEAPDDVGERFDLALATTRIGRGAHLVGLHLVLGVLRETLVLGMQLADRDAGTVHHRHGTAHDELAARVAAVAAGPVDVRLPLAAYDLHAETRRLLDPAHRPDPSGLHALLETPSDRPDADQHGGADRPDAHRPDADQHDGADRPDAYRPDVPDVHRASRPVPARQRDDPEGRG